MCWLSWDWLGSSWKLIDTSNLVASKALSAVSCTLNQTNPPTHSPYLVLTQLGHKKRDLSDLLHCHPTDSFSEVSGVSWPHASHPLETELGTSKPVVCRWNSCLPMSLTWGCPHCVRWYLLKQVRIQKESEKNQKSLLDTGQKYYSTWNWANATFVSKVSQLKFSLDKVTGKRPLVTKISKVCECPRSL